jgi:tetratricopeptide (TPR) repeat protein
MRGKGDSHVLLPRARLDSMHQAEPEYPIPGGGFRQMDSLFKKGALAVFPVCFLLGGLEGLAYLLRVEPLALSRDSMMGFSPGSPLFVGSPSEPGMLTTAPAKLKPFNLQSFSRVKGAGTKRIFCLGGSTTYGHPFDDRASFCNWLRHMLPLADSTTRWEVINAGGISYGSYRITEMMNELVQYDPDFFILYSGHNEFLENRTYAHIARLPPFLRWLFGTLEWSRGYSLLMETYGKLGGPRPAQKSKPVLPGEVKAILDNSYGPKDYFRNDTLSQEILSHYRASVTRIVGKAKQAGAGILLVSTPSNLLDCAPFKSEFSGGLTSVQKQRADSSFQAGMRFFNEARFDSAIWALESGIRVDSRHPDMLFYLGKSYYRTGDFEKAYLYLTRARDEDICPLRAFSEVPGWLNRIAQREGAPYLDFNRILEEKVREKEGHRLLGKHDFYDHVHLTVENHKLLAVNIVDKLAEVGFVKPSADWKTLLPQVSDKVMASLDKRAYGIAMHTLAKTLNWAGKHEEAVVAAESALAVVNDDLQAIGSALYIGTAFQRKRMLDSAITYYRLALRLDANNLEANQLIAKAYFLQEAYREARPFLEKALYLSGNSDRDLLLKMAQAWIFQKEPEKAVPYFERRAYLAPEDPKAQTDLAYSLLQSYQIDRAEMVLRSINQQFPNNADGWSGMGEVVMFRGRPAEALEFFYKAVQLDPSNPRYRAHLDRILGDRREK